MPAPATPIDALTPEQRSVLADISRVTSEISGLQGTLQGLTAERHALFVKARDAGIAISTIASVAAVSGPAVSKALAERGGV